MHLKSETLAKTDERCQLPTEGYDITVMIHSRLGAADSTHAMVMAEFGLLG